VRAKLLVAALIVLVLLSFSLYSAFTGKYLQSIAVLLAMILFVWVLLFGFDSVQEHWFLASIPAVLTVFSIFNAILSSPHSDHNRDKDNVHYFKIAMDAVSCSPDRQPDRERREAFNKMRVVLAEKCVRQNIVDVQTITVNLSKALYLDPVTSTIDSIYSEFGGKNEVTCGEMAKQLDSLCPGIIQ
jgi:hypothetical protein